MRLLICGTRPSDRSIPATADTRTGPRRAWSEQGGRGRINAALSVILCLLVNHMAVADDPSGANEERGNVSCGPRCLAIAALLCDNRQPTQAELERAFGGNVSGTHSYQDLEAAARTLGYRTRLVRLPLPPQTPRLLHQPLIVCKYSSERRENHCVVVYGNSNDSLHVIDFPRSSRLIPAREFAKSWDGWGLYIAKEATSLWTMGDVVMRVCDVGLFLLSLTVLVLSLRNLYAIKFWGSPP